MSKLPIAVLISGGGTTLQNLLHHSSLGELPVEFRLVISSHGQAKGLEFATEYGIPQQIVSRKCYADAESHSQAVFNLCREQGVELVVMGGYLEHLLIPPDYSGRVLNIHPSLIPAFSGKGFYGARVHQAALDYGVKVSGCTVHFVDNEYDHGPIVAQRACPVLEGDTVHSLQGRVFQLECQLYPAVIAAVARGQVICEGRHVTLHAIV